ncbi:MAG: rhodanese-like domain-containing protein [Polyangiaceae bacterium]
MGSAPTMTLTISDSAAHALKNAAEPGADVLRLEIDGSFKHDLFFGPPQDGDVEIASNGVTLHVAHDSAARANGLSIDYVASGSGMAFRIENPNEPPRVRGISPKELKSMMDVGEVELFDVRPPAERALASIAHARSLDGDGRSYLEGLAKDTPIALHCHHGMRSRAAGEQLLRQGFKKVYNLEGGIEAWAQDVDPTIPRY